MNVEKQAITKFPPLFIRADANSLIGIGHIMRCIALAQAWQKEGGEVIFISCCENLWLKQKIKDEGFGIITLKRTYPDPSDLETVHRIIFPYINDSNFGTPWVVLDGYHFSLDFQRNIHNARVRTIVIDDYNHHPQYCADIILNQDLNAKATKYDLEGGSTFLLGSRYILLRSEFINDKKSIKNKIHKAHRILVTLGGSDPDNCTLMIVHALKMLNIPTLEAKIIIGPENPNINRIKHEIEYDTLDSTNKKEQCSIRLIENAEMPDLIAWADIAICAGGGTCWELSYAEVPMMIIILSENQRGNAEALARCGTAINCGWSNKLQPVNLSSDLIKLIKNNDALEIMAGNGKKLVDGKGAERVVKKMKAIGDG